MGLFDGNGYDRVEIGLPTGEVRKLSRYEWESLPLDQRVRAILSKQLKFFRGPKEVTMKEALG
jgi:hypothetical protein